jgi:hypothetical protein
MNALGAEEFPLDNASIRVSACIMPSKLDFCSDRPSGWILRRTALAAALSCGLCATGCLSPLAKHSVALSAATTPVVDQAATAYRSAETIYDMRVDYEAVREFDRPKPVYNPRKIQPLMSNKDIEVRLAVLAAFQSYVQSLVAITNGTDSPQLDSAAKSVGENLSAVGNSLAPSIASTFDIALTSSTTQTSVTTTSGNTTTTSTSSTSAPPITPEVQNGISTAVDALGQFLVSRKVKKELPQAIKAMDPHVQVLCELLEKDIDTLQSLEQRDYNFIIDQQTLFIRTSPKLDPEQRREQIMKLPEFVRRQHTSDLQLSGLRASLVRLALTHHALAAEAQGNNPESFTSKLSELEAAGGDLGNFYSSLPTN